MKKLATFVMVAVLGCFVFGCIGCDNGEEEEGAVVPPPVVEPE